VKNTATREEKRTLRATIMGASVFSFIGAIFLLISFFGNKEVHFSEEQIQSQILKGLDKKGLQKGSSSHTSLKVVKEISIKDVNIKISNGKVSAVVSVEGTLIASKKFSLTAKAVGAPLYKEGAFYFSPTEIKVESFEYEGDKPGVVISKIADRYITDDKKKLLMKDIAPVIESWMTTTAQNAVMFTLEKRPIYTLKNDVKGVLIRSSLESVKIQDNELVLAFSVWEFGLSVAIGIFLLIASIAMVFALAQSPFLGVIAIAAP
jgi:hypothetical protein